mmetsp:Transcript_106613/g.195659  ORF Transcript_106613/g.195659 Transcript_106613/m.195659 type:complete len:92 (-) Transcript_106613:189-464(-)
MERGEKGEKVWGWDDVETGACVWRHLPEAKRVILQHSLWSVARAENEEVRTLVDSKDPKWATISAAHRMTVKLNYDAARVLAELRAGNSSL